MKNITNMFQASGYFQARGAEPKPTMHYVSAPLQAGINDALMLALIENLWYSIDIMKLAEIKQEAEQHLEICRSHPQLLQGCTFVIEMLTHMIKELQQCSPATSNALRDTLYTHTAEMAMYFQWVYQIQTPKSLAKKIADDYCKTVEIYQLKNGLLYETVRETSGEANGIDKVILFNNGQQPPCIIYEYTPYQLDNLSKIFRQDQQKILLVMEALNQKVKQLSECAAVHKEVLLRSRQLQTVLQQYEQQLKRVTEQKQKLSWNCDALRKDHEQAARQQRQINDQFQRKIMISIEKEQVQNQQNIQLRNTLSSMDTTIKKARMQADKLREEDEIKSKKIDDLLWKLDKAEEELKWVKADQNNLRAELQRLKSEQEQRPKVKPRTAIMQEEERVGSMRRTEMPQVRLYSRATMETEDEYNCQSQPLVMRKPLPPPPQQKSKPLVPAQAPKKSIPAAKAFSFAAGKFSKALGMGDTCKICFQQTQPYSLFSCTHKFCSDCLIGSIRSQIDNNEAVLRCPQNCDAQLDIIVLGSFLESMGEKALLQKYSQMKINKGECNLLPNEKIVKCPRCSESMVTYKTATFFEHCGESYCLKCGESHAGNVGCSPAMMLNVVNVLERPLICPQCMGIFDMDDKCQHVSCKTCQTKNIQPEGICPICSVLRSPIKAHDNSYHRSDCIFYQASPQAPKYNLKCVTCKTQGSACARPAETFQQFVSAHISAELYKRIQEIRKARPIKYNPN